MARIRTKLFELSEMTLRQFSRKSSLLSGPIINLGRKDGFVFCESTRPLTQQEIDNLKTALRNLSNAKTDNELEKEDFESLPFYQKTPQQVDDFIDNNVTDINSAKVVLKKYGRAILYLARRSDLNS